MQNLPDCLTVGKVFCCLAIRWRCNRIAFTVQSQCFYNTITVLLHCNRTVIVLVVVMCCFLMEYECSSLVWYKITLLQSAFLQYRKLIFNVGKIYDDSKI